MIDAHTYRDCFFVVEINLKRSLLTMLRRKLGICEMAGVLSTKKTDLCRVLSSTFFVFEKDFLVSCVVERASFKGLFGGRGCGTDPSVLYRKIC